MIPPNLFLQGGQLAYKIYDKWIRRSNQADVQYSQLASDVRNLSAQLSHLGDVFDNATRARPVGSSSRPGSARSASSLQERISQSKEIVGDFMKTLEDCNRLLVDNSRYGEPGRDIVRAALWHATLAGQSEHLRSRILFHCAKISFVLEPLKIELLDNVNIDTRSIKRMQRRILKKQGLEPVDAPQVDLELASHYENQARTSRPFESLEPYPLQHAVDALLNNFAQSTSLNPHIPPMPEQFNCLFKARWLVDRIEQHAAYRAMGTSLTRAVVTHVEDMLEEEYDKFDPGTLEVQKSNVLALGSDHTKIFEIWVVQETLPPLGPATTEMPGEEKILEVPLASNANEEESSVLVFRQSDTVFRIVSTANPTANQNIDTHSFRCVPRYAIPGDTSNFRLQVFLRRVYANDDYSYDFANPKDLLQMQHALTNYQVLLDIPSMKWQLSRDTTLSRISKRFMKDQGWSRVQIWEWNPLERIIPTANTPQTVANNAVRSTPRELSTRGDVASTYSRQAQSFVSRDSTGCEVVTTSPPNVPALVMFTKQNDKFTYLYVPLEKGILINSKRCDCLDNGPQCRFIVLEKKAPDRRKFEVKILTADSEQDWNLFRFVEPKSKDYETMKTIDTLQLTLEFDTVYNRKWFMYKLLQTIGQRSDAQGEIDEVIELMRYHESRGTTFQNSSTLFQSPRQSRHTSEANFSALPDRRGVTASSSASSTPRFAHATNKSQHTLASSYTPRSTNPESDPPLHQTSSRATGSSRGKEPAQHVEDVNSKQSYPRRGDTLETATLVASPISPGGMGSQTVYDPVHVPPLPKRNSMRTFGESHRNDEATGSSSRKPVPHYSSNSMYRQGSSSGLTSHVQRRTEPASYADDSHFQHR